MRKNTIILIIMIFILMISAAACGEEDRGKPLASSEVEDEETPQVTEDKDSDALDVKKEDIELPDPIKDGKESTIKVYDIDTKEIQEMAVNEYLYGVVAGEVGNDWPEEVLKAQAVIARTYMVNYFIEGDSSKYEGADISTDVSESQAYSKDDINDAIKKAVDDTVGIVITYQGEPIKAFFHSCSGGITATATEGLENKDELPYTENVESDDSSAPADVREWTGEYTKDKLIAALASMEEDIGGFETVEIGEKGPSGRALTLKFDDAEVSAPQFRLAISASDFRSTLITDLSYENDVLTVSGKGFGHGVGMPQWDAKALSENGADYEEIINTYFRDVDIVKAWE